MGEMAVVSRGEEGEEEVTCFGTSADGAGDAEGRTGDAESGEATA